MWRKSSPKLFDFTLFFDTLASLFCVSCDFIDFFTSYSQRSQLFWWACCIRRPSQRSSFLPWVDLLFLTSTDNCFFLPFYWTCCLRLCFSVGYWIWDFVSIPLLAIEILYFFTLFYFYFFTEFMNITVVTMVLCWDSRVFPNFEPWTTEIWLINDLFCFIVLIFWILFSYVFYWNVFLKSNGIFPVTDSRVLQRQFTNGVSVCMYVLSDSIGTILKTRPFVKTV